jgi:hypothetical protein
MANYTEQLQRLFDRYRSEVREAPATLDDVYTLGHEQRPLEGARRKYSRPV